MSNKIPQIKQELERRHLVCSKTTFKGFLVFAQEYIDFIKTTPLLVQIVNNLELKIPQSSFTSYTKHKVTFPIIFLVFKERVKELLHARTLSLWLKKGREQKMRNMHNFIHHYIVGKLSKDEILDSTDLTTKKPNKELEVLRLAKDATWEDIQINFIGEFDVRIQYKENNYTTTHEKLGFADKRQKDKTVGDAGWELLRILSLQNGVFNPENITGEELERRKKQKQKLSSGLKDYFGINGDPFLAVNKDKREYKVKIKLLPDPEFRPDWKDRNIFDTEYPPREFLKPID